jgi:hypothetical protein
VVEDIEGVTFEVARGGDVLAHNLGERFVLAIVFDGVVADDAGTGVDRLDPDVHRRPQRTRRGGRNVLGVPENLQCAVDGSHSASITAHREFRGSKALFLTGLRGFLH